MRALHSLLTVLCCFVCGMAMAAPLPVQCFPPNVMRAEDTLFIPLQPLAELAGLTLATDKTGAVTVSLHGKTFTCTAKSKSAKANGQPITLPAAPGVLFQGGLCAPLLPCVKALNGTVVEEGEHVKISLPGLAEPLTCPVSYGWGENPTEMYDRSIWILFSMNADGSGLRRLSFNAQNHAPDLPAFSFDGTMLAYYDHQTSKFVVRPVAGGAARPLVRAGSYVVGEMPDFSRDGQYLYTSNNGGTYKTAVADGVSRRICPGETQVVSPDGAHLAVVIEGRASVNSTLWLTDLDGGNRIALGNGTNPIFSPDGSVLAFSRPTVDGLGNPHSALAFYMVTGPQAGTTNEPPIGAGMADQYGACFTPDGKSIVFVDGNIRSVSMMNIDRTGERQICESQSRQGYVHDLHVAQDGKTLFFIRGNGNLYRINLDGSGLTPLTKNLRVANYSFTSDGAQLLLLAGMNEERETEY